MMFAGRWCFEMFARQLRPSVTSNKNVVFCRIQGFRYSPYASVSGTRGRELQAVDRWRDTVAEPDAMMQCSATRQCSTSLMGCLRRRFAWAAQVTSASHMFAMSHLPDDHEFAAQSGGDQASQPARRVR